MILKDNNLASGLTERDQQEKTKQGDPQKTDGATTPKKDQSKPQPDFDQEGDDHRLGRRN